MRDRFLWIGCIAYAAGFSAIGALKYDVHRNLVDFGIFAQTAASAFGCFCNPIEGSHWAYHFSPVLYAVGAAVALAHVPLTLIAIQAIAGALTAPPVYALVYRINRDRRVARLAATVVWLYPALAGLIFGDFHENGLAPAAVAWTLYAFDAGLLAWTAVFAALTLAIKEDQALFLGIAGALGAWHYRGTPRGRVAATIGIAGGLVLLLFFAVIQPHAAAGAVPNWQPERFYAWGTNDFANLPEELLVRAGFLVLALGPLLFLPFGTKTGLLAVAPLAEVLFSRMPTTYTMGTHYAGAWIGYVLVAYAAALRRLSPARARMALLLSIVLCVVELAVADPLHPAMNLRPIQTRDLALDRFLRALPLGVSVATQEEAYTHLALRDSQARLLPEDSSLPLRACFVLVDGDFPDSARLKEYAPAFVALVNSGLYVAVARVGSIELYRRAARCY